MQNLLYKRITWRILPIVMTGYILSYLDRVNVGFAKLQMLDDLKFSETIYGLGAAIFFVGYFLFEMPSNIIMHKVGARRWLARIMFTWAILSGACMFINSPTTFYVLRFLLGIAEAGFFPGIILYITYWYPADRQAAVVGLFMSAIALSGIIGGPLSGAIMQHMAGVNGWAGWQWMFLLEAIPTFLFGFVFLKYLPNGPADATFLSKAERAVVLGNLGKKKLANHSVLATLKQGHIWKLACLYLCQTMGVYGFTFWVPSLIKEAGVTNVQDIGFLTAIPYLFAICWMNLVARHSDAYNERHRHHLFTAVAGAAGLIAFTLIKDYGQLEYSIAALCLAAGGILTMAPLFWAISNQFYAGPGAAAAIGAIGAFANISGFIAPYLIGYIKDATGTTSIGVYTVAAFVLLGTICLQATKRWKT